MKIWLDDLRNPPDERWTWAKTAEAAWDLFWLHSGGVTAMSLDHDLGEGQTGYDFLRRLEEAVVGRGVRVWWPAVTIHSANPVGQANMQMALAAIEKSLKARAGLDEKYNNPKGA